MGIYLIPLCVIVAILVIAFLFASLQQVKHKTRYIVLYVIAIIMLFAVIPACACAFAEHDLIIAPSIAIQQKETCSQQDLMYFVCSAFFNMGKKRNDIVSFLYKVFPIYFPAGESVLAKKMPGQERVKERREKENN